MSQWQKVRARGYISVDEDDGRNITFEAYQDMTDTVIDWETDVSPDDNVSYPFVPWMTQEQLLMAFPVDQAVWLVDHAPGGVLTLADGVPIYNVLDAFGEAPSMLPSAT